MEQVSVTRKQRTWRERETRFLPEELQHLAVSLDTTTTVVVTTIIIRFMMMVPYVTS